jgi:hypothetical protein
MEARDELPWHRNGSLVFVDGELSSVCVHEAAHRVISYVLDGATGGGTFVNVTYKPIKYGGLLVSPAGRAEQVIRHNPVGFAFDENWLEVSHVLCPDADLQSLLNWAIIICAGHAGQLKHARSVGFPLHHAPSDGDRFKLEIVARAAEFYFGRSYQAFKRLAWARACKMLDDPKVWKAVKAVDGALFSGIIWLEPENPKPFDRTEFELSFAAAEEIMRNQGLTPRDSKSPLPLKQASFSKCS